ncbi:MAG: AraC family transcriptional regulator [Rhodospirillales bacterium]|nr:AraC family transcriptional regulator [Rhodospirillales bacterium]
MTVRKYPVGQDVAACCTLLDVDVETVLQKSGLKFNANDIIDASLTAEQCFNFLYAVIAEYGQDDFHIKLANGYVKSPIGAAHMGFVASATIADGIGRISKIKPTMAPTLWDFQNTSEGLQLKLHEGHPKYPVNGFGEIMSFIWIVKSCRKYSLQNIKPQRIVISSDITYKDGIETDLQCKIEVSSHNLLEFDAETAALPLITNCDFIAKAVDQETSKRLSQISMPQKVSMQAEQSIRRILASGNVTAERISTELAMSKRTFERRLNEEGITFRKLLEGIKAELALEYLSDQTFSVPEISFMLGFEEPNSFFRAFKRWHGSTPNQIRSSIKNSHIN